ncbi:hypothetical protein [Methanobrevibacter olleyae]|uniref:hypothetical protein n=1 Tax=Methanobrevibacter olleyae TaxID=294671 RepID=UPI00130D88CA|nr:hypothetical protein [Methanobrevibacter olleyae]
MGESIFAEGYNMYCTRVETSKSYCRNRYKNEPNKKYGRYHHQEVESFQNME